VCIALRSTSATGNNHALLFGSCLIFGVVLCDALFTLLAKSVAKRVSTEAMTLIVVYSSCLLFLPLGIWQMLHFSLSALSTKDWLSIGYLGTTVNAAAYRLWYAGLKHVSANQAGVFTAVMPISSLLLSSLLLGEHITLLQVVGLALVLGGVLLTTEKPAPPPLENQEILD